MADGRITKQELDPSVFNDTEKSLEIIEQKVDLANTKIDNLSLKINAIRGFQKFNTPGTHTWVCPEGVKTIFLTMFGGGGGGQGAVIGSPGVVNTPGRGGGGGAFSNKVPATVIPGQTYTVVVGSGGQGGQTMESADSSLRTGKTGGTSTAFGFICAGGNGIGMGGDPDNSGFTSKGADGQKGWMSSLSWDSNVMQPQSTPFAIATGTSQQGLGLSGGAGFGSGGTDKGNGIFTHAGFGAGGAGTYNASYAQKGGDGIVIIEW